MVARQHTHIAFFSAEPDIFWLQLTALPSNAGVSVRTETHMDTDSILQLLSLQPALLHHYPIDHDVDLQGEGIDQIYCTLPASSRSRTSITILSTNALRTPRTQERLQFDQDENESSTASSSLQLTRVGPEHRRFDAVSYVR